MSLPVSVDDLRRMFVVSFDQSRLLYRSAASFLNLLILFLFAACLPKYPYFKESNSEKDVNTTRFCD